MTQAKFMKLYVELLKGEMTANEIAELKHFSDDEIDCILSMNNKNAMKRLLINKEFRNLPKNVQERLINVIKDNETNTISIDYAIEVATNKDVIESGKVFELTRLIISNKREQKQIELAYAAAINPSIIKNGNVVATVISILTSESIDLANKKYEEAIQTAHIKKIEENQETHSFWDLFVANPTEALEALASSIFEAEQVKYEMVGQEKPVLADTGESTDILEIAKVREIPSYARVRRKNK